MTDPVQTPAAAIKPVRATARLAAVQALYQMELANTDLSEILAGFKARGAVGDDDDDDELAPADLDHFEDIVRGVVADQVKIDRAINNVLVDGWKMPRLDATLRAILRAGAFELTHRPDIPYKVAITEYINVAHAFFEGDEPGFANGVLDHIARIVREETAGHDRAAP